MRVIIAGGRRYRLTAADRVYLDSLLNVSVVIVGGAPGADTDAEQWARDRGIPCAVVKAAWGRFGPNAGPIRNAAMAQLGTHLVAFPGGDGTASMVLLAERAGLTVYDLRTP